MYSVIGIQRLLVAYGTVAAVLFCGVLAVEQSSLATATNGGAPALVGFLWGAASKGLTGAGLLFWVVGETPLFSLVCRMPGIRKFVPDLDGEWAGTLDSNWPQVSARLPQAPASQSAQPAQATEPRAVKVRFQARLLAVTMTLDTESGYSDSESILVGVEKRPGSGAVQVRYIYLNRTRKPLPTDSDSHLGAAVLDLDTRGGASVLSGPYWTNRNWHKGLNTAGILTLRRVQAP